MALSCIPTIRVHQALIFDWPRITTREIKEEALDFPWNCRSRPSAERRYLACSSISRRYSNLNNNILHVDCRGLHTQYYEEDLGTAIDRSIPLQLRTIKG